jgi:uncharacterized protein
MDIVSKLNQLLEEFPGIHTAILYGSYATGKIHPGSDLDIAIAEDKKMSMERKLELYNRLHKITHIEKIDLIDLHTIDGLILKEILTKGKVLKKNSDFLFRLLQKMLGYMADFYPIVLRHRKAIVEKYK